MSEGYFGSHQYACDNDSQMASEDESEEEMPSDPREAYRYQQSRIIELQEALQKQQVSYDNFLQPLFKVERTDHDDYYSETEYHSIL